MDIDKLLWEEHNLLKVKINDGKDIVSGFFGGEMEYGFSSKYDASGSVVNQVADMIGEVYKGALGTWGELFKRGFKQNEVHKGQNIFQTYKVWNASEMNGLGFNFVVIERNKGVGVREGEIGKAKRLLAKWVLSSNIEEKGENAFFMQAPNGYGWDKEEGKFGIKANKTLGLYIQDRFRCPGGMLLQSVSFDEKAARDEGGNPVILVVKVGFEYHRTVLYEDYLEWTGLGGSK